MKTAESPALSMSLWRAKPQEALLLRTSLGAALGAAAQRWPAQDAVVFACQPDIGDVRWSYRELDRTSARLAGALLARGRAARSRIPPW